MHVKGNAGHVRDAKTHIYINILIPRLMHRRKKCMDVGKNVHLAVKPCP